MGHLIVMSANVPTRRRIAKEGYPRRDEDSAYTAGEKMSGVTNNEVGAPETRITVPMELVLTPRDNCLNPVLGPVIAAQSKLTP
jgi:hypothetical protein